MASIFKAGCGAAVIGVVLLGGLLASEATAQRSTSALANAMLQSRSSGKPIFAVAGSDSCPACKALMERLRTDQSLSEFAAHYVTVSVTYGQDSAWSEWNRKYPIESNAIPRLYIVRSDGKQIYADAGAPQGESLVRLLRSSLEEAGSGLSDKDSIALEQAVTRVQAAMEANDLIGQAMAIAEVYDVAKSANGFHPTVQQLRELFDEFAETLQSLATEGNLQLSEGKMNFEQVVGLVEIASAYELFPHWRAKANETLKDLRKHREYTEMLKQAESLVSARVMASRSDLRQRKRAAGLYAAVLKRYPETEAAQLARAALETVDPDHIALNTQTVGTIDKESSIANSHEPESRTWTSADGKFSREAILIDKTATEVKLQSIDGKKLTIKISQLSATDRQFLTDQDR